MKQKTIELRSLIDKDSDYKLLEKWYQEKEIYSHFEQRVLSFIEIKEKYYERTLNNSKIPVFMIEYEGLPVGIIQYQLINEDNKKLYNICNDKSYEIDIFIGELNLHNKGIGKKSIELMTNYLIKEKQAELLVMCPLKDNKNAIRCYESCGFDIKREFSTKDTIGNLQNYILMIKEI